MKHFIAAQQLNWTKTNLWLSTKWWPLIYQHMYPSYLSIYVSFLSKSFNKLQFCFFICSCNTWLLWRSSEMSNNVAMGRQCLNGQHTQVVRWSKQPHITQMSDLWLKLQSRRAPEIWLLPSPEILPLRLKYRYMNNVIYSL